MGNTIQSSFPVHDRIFKRECEILEYMLNKHSRVLLTRLDLRYPESLNADGGNNDVSRCLAKANRKLKAHNCNPAYLFVREQKSREKNPHYHCVFFANGHVFNSPQTIQKVVENCWSQSIGLPNLQKGLVDYCTQGKDGKRHRNYVLLKREETIPDDAIAMLSYPAKPNDKGDIGDGVRDFGCSQLKSRQSKNRGEKND